MTHKGQTQADIDAVAIVAERATIIAELDKLEVYVPRVVEDMIPLMPGFVVARRRPRSSRGNRSCGRSSMDREGP